MVSRVWRLYQDNKRQGLCEEAFAGRITDYGSFFIFTSSDSEITQTYIASHDLQELLRTRLSRRLI